MIFNFVSKFVSERDCVLACAHTKQAKKKRWKWGRAVSDELHSVFVSSFFGEILAKFWPEKYGFEFRPIQRIFRGGKMGSNSPHFEEKKFQIARFLWLVRVGSQGYRKFPIFFYFHSQIWLNRFMDDHFSYITKLGEKNTLGAFTS